MDAQIVSGLWEKLWENYQKSGAIEDRWEIIKANAGLVGSVVPKYLGQGLSYDELFSEGQMGLIAAVDNFKPELGSAVAFARSWSSFARERIVGHILNALKNLHKRSDKFRPAADYEMEIEFNESELEIEFKAEPIGSEMERSEIWKEVNRVATEKESTAIVLVFKEGLTYREAAEKLGMSFQHTHALVRSGLQKCRTSGSLNDFHGA